MIDGLKFIKDLDGSLDVKGWDDEGHPFDTEDDFNENSIYWENQGYKCYYFGDGEDGAMKTGKNTIEIDGDNYNFYFEKSGGKKGQGVTGEKDDKYYQSGKLIKAGSDEKYQVVLRTENGEDENGKVVYAYQTLDDFDEFKDTVADGVISEGLTKDNLTTLRELGVNKDADDLSELYIINKDTEGKYLLNNEKFFLVNTSGKVIDTNSKSKDGSDYVFVTKKAGSEPGQIVAIYVED